MKKGIAPVYFFLLICAVCLLLPACFTPALWDATNPDEYIEVKNQDISVEELEAKGIKYWKAERSGKIYMKKNGLRKFRDYTVRMFATPITVTLDTAVGVTYLVVVGRMSMFHLDSEQIEQLENNPDAPHPWYPKRK